jgi:RNA polymerase sigma-70 factor (ECF subfamily)
MEKMSPGDVTALFKDHKLTAKRLREGDRRVIEAVIDAYMGQIYRAALGAGLDETRAEDVTQATFVTFLEKAGGFDGRSHVRTWLFGIMYNKIMETHRETRRAREFDPIDEVVEQRFDERGGWQRPPRRVDAGVHEEDLRNQIDDCMEGVPMTSQLALVLREVEGFSTGEICDILKLTRTHLGVALHRGRNKIRECLESMGLRSSADAKL